MGEFQEQEEGTMSKSASLRDLFLSILAREGGEQAVECFLNGWDYPIKSNGEAAHNRAVKAVIKSKEFRSLPPMSRLAALASWLKPVKGFGSKNPEAEAVYKQAEAVYNQALDDALLRLSPDEVRMLRDDLRSRANRLLTLKRKPEAEILAGVSLKRYWVKLYREAEDAWQAWLLDDIDRQLVVSPTKLRAGHVSPDDLSLDVLYREDALSKPVIVVLVGHRVKCELSDCSLPAATEFYLHPTKGWQGTPWWVGVDEWEVQTRPVGEIEVRQGDMLFRLSPFPPRMIDELPKARPPEWTRFHRPEGVLRWVWVNEELGVGGVVDSKEVYIHHPDYPHARLRTTQLGPFLLFARPVKGKKQSP
jgi:hypothetical protein